MATYCYQKFFIMSQKASDSLSTSTPLFLSKTITSTPHSSECGHTSNAEEERDDREKEWYERWDYSHIGDTDIDLHY